MPHRTRVPTIGGAAPTPQPTDPAPSSAHAETAKRASHLTKGRGKAPARNEPTPSAAIGPDELARGLRAMATELERDATLARRVSAAMCDIPSQPPSPAGTQMTKRETAEGDTGNKGDRSTQRTARPFRPRVVAGASPDLGPGIPDPFALRARLGEAGLRQALGDLRLGTLRAMVREHHLDPDGAAVRGNDAARLRTLILQRTSQ